MRSVAYSSIPCEDPRLVDITDGRSYEVFYKVPYMLPQVCARCLQLYDECYI